MNDQCGLDRQMLKDVHLAVCGDEKLGIPGLVEVIKRLDDRLTIVEIKESKLKTKLIAVGALLIGATLGLKEVILALITK